MYREGKVWAEATKGAVYMSIVRAAAEIWLRGAAGKVPEEVVSF